MSRSLIFAMTLVWSIVVAVPETGNAQTAQIVPALVGITQSNGILPCVGNGATACYGIPNGAVALQPEMFIQPGVAATWYVVFQTGAWSGNLKVTFDLVENKAVVQSANATATAAANSTVLVTVSQSAPSNGYNGGATLDVGAVAIPTGGGTPVRLKSSVAVQVGSTTNQFAIAVAGPSQYKVAPGMPPCIGGQFGGCYGVPTGAAVWWPENIAPANYATLWTVVFQTGAQKGAAQHVTFALTELGATVMTYEDPTGVALKKDSLAEAGAAEPTAPSNGYTGLAVLTVTAVAGTGQAAGPARLIYSVPVLVLPPVAE